MQQNVGFRLHEFEGHMALFHGVTALALRVTSVAILLAAVLSCVSLPPSRKEARYHRSRTARGALQGSDLRPQSHLGKAAAGGEMRSEQ